MFIWIASLNRKAARLLPKTKVMRQLPLLLSLLLLFGCSPETQPLLRESPRVPRLLTSPPPGLTNEPAEVYGSVLTTGRVISLVFEGYSDEYSIQAVLETLQTYRAPSVFFISGIVADEHPDVVRKIAQSGYLVGNYGLNAPKNMQDMDVWDSVYQFRRGQELVRAAAGVVPTLFRCNGSKYTRELLKAASFAGLEAGILPSEYLNHRSFSQEEDARVYARRIFPGAIVSIKLGQELDAEEYQRAIESMDNLAVDPPPHLSDDMEEIIRIRYENVSRVTSWLLEALTDEGYTLVLPEMLQADRITMFDAPMDLDSETRARLDVAAGSLPVTERPLGSQAGSVAVDFSGGGVVMVGDAITSGLEDYVSWRRLEEPGYMGDTRFFASVTMGVRDALMSVTDRSVHPEAEGRKMTLPAALSALGAKTVLLMPGLSDVRQYSKDVLINALKMMVYQIRGKNPDIRIVVQSIPPGMATKTQSPDNREIFLYNLEVYRFCASYGIPFIDVAFALRDGDGNLPEKLCLDPDTQRFRLNDEGCLVWIDCIRNGLPP